MCDCYYHKCQGPNCNEVLPVHIGDYSTPRSNLEVYCSRHLPKDLETFSGAVWKWTRKEEYYGRSIPKGMRMGIVVKDPAKVGKESQGWEDYKNLIYPNSSVCEKIKDWR